MMSLIALVTGTCYYINNAGQYIDLNNGVMCPQITAIESTQPQRSAPATTPSGLSPDSAFLNDVITLTSGGANEAVLTADLLPFSQGQRICQGLRFNEAQPNGVTDAEFIRYQAVVTSAARRYLCP